MREVKRRFTEVDGVSAGQKFGRSRNVANACKQAQHANGWSEFFYKDSKCAAALLMLALSFNVIAGQVETGVTTHETASFHDAVEVDLPSQPLANSLKQFATATDLSLAFDSSLALGKTAPAVKGKMTRGEALNRILAGSGLKANLAGSTAIISGLPDLGETITTKAVNVRAQRFKQLGPLPGLALTKEQIAGNIQSLTAEDIKQSRSMSMSDLMNTKLQSVNVNDYQSNPFQMDVTYRGFTAGPQIGTPQGLSVFFDGIRVNEPFGDVVNWDMIPMNALEGMDIFPGSNPLFGLNTLGGALAMRTKSGFTTRGVSAEILGGSFGRRQLQASAGWNNGDEKDGGWSNGNVAAFGAVNVFLEDGWRDNSPSRVNQGFGKLEWQGERASLSFSTLAVVNKLRGNGTIPMELYDEDPSSVFTSPDETRNQLLQFQVAGAFDVTDTFSLTGHAYHRDSRRKSSTGDMIDKETFSNADNSYGMYATHLPGQSSGLQCGYSDSNRDGLPDYYVFTTATWYPFRGQYLSDGTFNYALAGELNPVIPDELRAGLQQAFKSGVIDFKVNGDFQFAGRSISPDDMTVTSEGLRYRDGGSNRWLVAAPPMNADTCQNNGLVNNEGMKIPANPDERKRRDGNYAANPSSGWVEGTPTAIITDTDIDQTANGAALQLNWNFDEHKLLLGASVDRYTASYIGKQRLALLDEQRNVFSDPSQLGEEYWAGSHDVTINDFDGKSETKSLYFSETWSPSQTLNFSFSTRYNKTDVENHLAPSIADSRLANLHLLNRYVAGVICPGGDAANCPYGLDGPIPANEYWDKLIPPEVRESLLGQGANLLDKRQTEEFSYHSLNPAIGATWQAKPNLNLYANWNQGTRAPSVIELGCAFDDTPTPHPLNPALIRPRSVIDQRGCKLPSALSGDPYLPQVVAQTAEIGARGKFNDFLEWNVSAYRTNVRDDIYLTSVTNELSFFQSIGDTRRQGIEFGLVGEYGKSDFRLNYSLTEATFQSTFKMLSPNNSSRSLVQYSPDQNMITVEPGNVMPGVPFNNLNLGWGYRLTPKLKINFNVVAHSSSYLRGNENNAHTPSPSRVLTDANGGQTRTPDNHYAGTVPGYAVVNFHGSYDLGKGWIVGATINNLLDKEYYTAGRLGESPFAPSTIGAIGPGGFNYNSSEWISSQFVAPGAPRGVWFSLGYDFDASKKYDPPPSTVSMTEPDRLLDLPDSTPSAEELALIQRLDKIKALPVLKRRQADANTRTAELEVKASVEAWRKALADNDAQAFLESYASFYAPPGVSHNDWSEQLKLRFVTDAAVSVEVNDLVVADQGGRFVAVFYQHLMRGEQAETVRKVLTFEQKEGQWKITRDHELPFGKSSNIASAETAMAKNSPAVREAR